MLAIPGLIQKRGSCGGMFSRELQEAERRVSWCSFNARLIDLPPVVTVESLLGVGVPERVSSLFRGEPDEYGFFDHDEDQRCPLSFIDPKSPQYDPGYLGQCLEVSRSISAELPSKWLPDDPTEILFESVITIRGEVEQAAAYKAEKNEDW